MMCDAYQIDKTFAVASLASIGAILLDTGLEREGRVEAAGTASGFLCLVPHQCLVERKGRGLLCCCSPTSELDSDSQIEQSVLFNSENIFHPGDLKQHGPTPSSRDLGASSKPLIDDRRGSRDNSKRHPLKHLQKRAGLQDDDLSSRVHEESQCRSMAWTPRT